LTVAIAVIDQNRDPPLDRSPRVGRRNGLLLIAAWRANTPWSAALGSGKQFRWSRSM
jgi:hypothetical protein